MSKDTIAVTGLVLVSDILTSFEAIVSEELLAGLDAALASRANDRLMFDDCEVLVEEAVDALDDSGNLPEPEGLGDTLDQGDVRELAEAIRCGDVQSAEIALDRMFGHDATLREWIDLGRYSPKARVAKSCLMPKLRSAA